MTLEEQLSRSAKQLRFSQENLNVAVGALNELRDLAESGSAEMACIDEALGKMGYTPWQQPHPCLVDDHRTME